MSHALEEIKKFLVPVSLLLYRPPSPEHHFYSCTLDQHKLLDHFSTKLVNRVYNVPGLFT